MTNTDRRAPKDAIAKKRGFLVLKDKAIGATLRADGIRSQETYTDNGRLLTQARMVGEIKDEAIIDLLKTAEGFKKLVHSVGVSITAEKQDSEMEFRLVMYGKKDKYGSGTLVKMPVVTNGIENVLQLSEVEWKDDDDVIGCFTFVFPEELSTASVSVRLYVHDCYEVPDEIPDAPVNVESDEYKALIDKSVYSVGNTARIKRVIEKARRGEDIMMSYIGGSITQGAGAVPITTECWDYKSMKSFAHLFAKDESRVHYVKAGMGGTPSELGLTRFAMHALRDEVTDGADTWRGGINPYKTARQKNYPDIVFIEFAVNDEGDETKGDCYEGLCRMAWNSPGKPAVVLMFSVFADDTNLEERIRPIGEKLGLPMVSAKAAVTEQFRLTPDTGRVVSKKQYFYDMFHPANIGHTIMADCLTKYFVLADAAPADEDIDQLPVFRSGEFDNVTFFDRRGIAVPGVENGMVNGEKITDPAVYNGTDASEVSVLCADGSVKKENIKISAGMFTDTDKEVQSVEIDLISNLTPMYPTNFSCGCMSSSAEPFRMEINCRLLMLVAKDSGAPDFGQVDIMVDGRLSRVYNAREIGWNHANAVVILREQQASDHVIEIKPSEGNEGKKFTILGFSYA